MTTLPGKRFLQIPGILYVIFAGIGIPVSIFGIVSADFWDFFMPVNLPWATYYGLSLVYAGFQLFLGIMGILHCNNPAKTELLFALAVLNLILAFAFVAFMLYVSWLMGLFSFTEFVLPILFLVGALRNRSAAQ